MGKPDDQWHLPYTKACLVLRTSIQAEMQEGFILVAFPLTSTQDLDRGSTVEICLSTDYYLELFSEDT